MLRIIGGKYGGRKLEQPPLKITRPTIDRVKEAIFSALQFKIPNSLVLDLFAGSSSLAIEAISRGAMKAIAVENNKEAVAISQKNIDILNISNILIVQEDVLSYLTSKSNTKFDYIFIDPPYSKFMLANQALLKIASGKMLKSLGTIILETSFPHKINIPKNFVIKKNKKYGKVTILLITNNI